MTASQDLAALVDSYVESTVRAALAPLQDQLNTVNAHAADLTSQLTAAQAMTDQDEAQITDLTSQLASANQTVTTLRGQVATLQAQIAALQALPTVPAYPAGWTTAVFEDYFNGTALDPAKWTAKDNVSNANESSRLQAKNVTVDGVCHITAKAEVVAGRNWTSGYISTQGHFASVLDKPYRIEARLKLPMVDGKSSGLWPAFWLRNAPGVGEIDLLESVGSPGAGHFAAGNSVITFWSDTAGGHVLKVGKNGPTLPWNEWHVIALEADPVNHSYVVKYDEVVVQTVTPVTDSWYSDNGSLPHQPASFVASAPYASPWYILLNLQVGGSWPGQPDANTLFPADFQVDYVRAFTH